MADPIETDPDKYRVVFENERVRVLEYRDEPASVRATTHPDSVMVTSAISTDDRRAATASSATSRPSRGVVRWLDAQTHSGRTSARRRRTPSASSSGSSAREDADAERDTRP